MTKLLISAIVLAITMEVAVAQTPNRNDYARAVSFLNENVNNKKAFNVHVEPNWFADSTGFWYTMFSKTEKSYYKVIFKPLQKALLFDHGQLAEKLGVFLKTGLDAKNLELGNIKYVNKELIEFTARGKKLQWNTKSNTLSESTKVKEEPYPLEEKSLDGKWIAYIDNHSRNISSRHDGTTS